MSHRGNIVYVNGLDQPFMVVSTDHGSNMFVDITTGVLYSPEELDVSHRCDYHVAASCIREFFNLEEFFDNAEEFDEASVCNRESLGDDWY